MAAIHNSDDCCNGNGNGKESMMTGKGSTMAAAAWQGQQQQ